MTVNKQIFEKFGSYLMSEGDPSDFLGSWMDICSLDIQPLSAPDSYFMITDDQDGTQHNDSPPASMPLAPEASRHLLNTQRQRHPYGMGIDALRTRPYRHYPMAQSPTMRQLQSRYGLVTNQMLRNLIGQALSHAPENMMLRPPTRDQRRAKGGLISWIDDNAAFVRAYLRNNAAESLSQSS
jgi:hypothetical protein